MTEFQLNVVAFLLFAMLMIFAFVTCPVWLIWYWIETKPKKKNRALSHEEIHQSIMNLDGKAVRNLTEIRIENKL